MKSRRLWVFSTLLIMCLAFLGLVSLGAGAETQSPTATPTSSPTVPPPDCSFLEQRIDKIEERVEVLEEPQALHLTVENPPKDLWDIVKVLSGLFAAALVAAVGAIATRVYNRRQLAVQRMQVIQRFMPKLQSSNPEVVEAALISISVLDASLALELGKTFPSQGVLNAFSRFAESPNQTVARRAKEALAYLERATSTNKQEPTGEAG
jgi:hypothetical protein